MTWRAANSLLVLEHQLQAGAPRAAPPATPAEAWGTIGDALHDPTSDHSPKDFPGLGNDVVTALDIPHAPALGLDSRAVCDDIRRSRDGRVKYLISQDQICSSYATANRAAWEWGPYNPNDPNRDRHGTHAHISVVGDSRSDSWASWATIGGQAAAGEEDDMAGSLGPMLMRSEDMQHPICMPPVEGGIADPRRTWLNAGIDFGGPCHLRIWQTNGDGVFTPLHDTNPDGVIALKAGIIFSVQLQKGVRLLSVLRVADPSVAGATVAFGPVSFCLERQ
jgi:hypothetical protein